MPEEITDRFSGMQNRINRQTSAWILNGTLYHTNWSGCDEIYDRLSCAADLYDNEFSDVLPYINTNTS